MHKKIALPLAVGLVLLITLSVGIPVSAAERIYQYDFEEDSTSDTFEDLLMYDFFDYKLPANTNSTATIQEEGDNQFLALEGYVSIRSWDEMQDYPYTFSLDIRQSVFNNIGFFVRGITPGEMTVINPRNANKEQDFDYFEVDWYTQNGGKNGTTTIGGSGIFVFPQENAFRVGVKVYREDGLTISSEYYDFPLPEGFSYDNFYNLEFTDNGTEVSISVNDQLLSKIVLSGPGKQYDTDNTTSFSYFETAEIQDASGNAVLTVQNTRVNSGASQLAIGVRNVALQIDNVSVSYEVPDNATPAPEEPDETEAPEETDSAPTPDASEATRTPAATATPTSGADSDESDSFPLGLVIGIAAAVVVILCVIIIIAVKKKKK